MQSFTTELQCRVAKQLEETQLNPAGFTESVQPRHSLHVSGN